MTSTVNTPGILVVEDEALVALDIQRQLVALGYQVVARTARGEDAITLAGELRPDLVLMDIQLAGALDGVEAADAIRTQFALPVVFLTAFAEDDVVARATRTDPFGYLIKPFSGPELRVAVELALYKHKVGAQLRESEQALRASEERMALAEQLGGTGSWVYDVASNTIWGSAQGLRMFGYPPVARAWPIEDIEACIPERERVHQALVALLSQGRDYNLEYAIRPADGSPEKVIHSIARIQTDAQGKPLRVLGFIQDITERKEIENELRESNELLSLFVRQSPIYSSIKQVTPSASRVLLASDNFEQMIGIAGADMLGKTQEELFPAAMAAKITADDWRVISTRTALTLDEEFDGRRYTTTKLPIIQEGRTLLAGYTIDITERKRAEEALQSSLREKEALLKEVHHRVKSNLQVVASLLRLEAARSAQPDTKAVLGDMQGRIRSLALLHEALYRSGPFAAVDLEAYLREIITQSFRALAPSPGAVQLELNLAPVRVEMDQAMPCGLLVNELVSNSLKHGFPDGHTGALRVELQPVDGGPQLRLRVSDTGVGLPEGFAPGRATSLGLQLVTDLAKQLGGALETGPGAVFTVTFTARHLKASPNSA